jgi:glycosyltransferase involved in cell wall biosynthesis
VQKCEYEHIVLDAGSEDGTGEIVSKYPIRYMSEEKEGPIGERLNLEFREAEGDTIGWINSDDTYEPGAFGTVSEFMGVHPRMDFVYSDCRFIGENDKEVGLWKTSQFSYFRNLNYAQMIPQPRAFFRKEVLDTVGYMEEKHEYAIDYDFFIRVSKNFKIARIPGVIANFRLHENLKTVGQRENFEPGVRKIRKEHGAVIPCSLVKLINRSIELVKNRHWGI